MTNTLVRSLNTAPNAPFGDWKTETAVGHPAIPQAAFAPLRKHLCDRASVDRVIRWWNVDGNAWAAVTDLHQVGDHASATALAELLNWCQKNGGGSNRTPVIWTINPV